MGQLLYIQCKGCQFACPCSPAYAKGLWESFNSEDKAVSEMAKDMLELRVVGVICQQNNKPTLIYLGG